ncbi:MAG TPA: cytochrome C biosynthesis protein, partial [Sphingomonas bacterium]|nr:cytochrome C biosynthesis protein [Sphingomonas bacterium]
GPYFYEGLAQIRAGNLAAARPLWIQALRVSPRNAPWRENIALRLVLLDRFVAMQASGQGMPR